MLASHPHQPSSPAHSLPRDAGLALLALGAALWLPMVLAASGWLPAEPVGLYVLAALAWVTGVVLAATNASDNASRLVAVLLGLVAGAHFAARILPPPQMIGGDIARVASWLWSLAKDGTPSPDFPLSHGAAHLYWQTQDLLERLGLWAYHLRRGTPHTDNAALLLATAVGVWVLAYNATYELVARQRAFAGLLPVAVAVGANVTLGHMSDVYIYAFLGMLVVALVWANVSHMERRWARFGLEPRRAFRLATLAAGVFLGTLALGAALAAPNVTYAQTFYNFWQEYGARIEAFYRRMDDAFAGRNPIARRAEAQAAVVTINVLEVPVTPSPATTMPAHTIGAGADLGDEPVMWVRIDSAPEGQSGLQGLATKYYWRERTYNIYTGRGWDNEPTEATAMAAGTPWTATEGPRRTLVQTVTMLRPSAYAYGANEPVSLSVDYTVIARGSGDLVALATAAESYTVVSHVPIATVAELRAAEGEYPAWARERYMVLPPIPERVRTEAYRVVSAAGATTRYDQARAIETYLRGMTYDLEVPAPPARADAVDHFLFETRAGFCDHSASAMTVMLRALGIAARYVSGYGMGEYHPERNAWLVTSANAHAWVEVYFPGLGWIEFEPTPVQSTFQRPETLLPTPDPAVAPQASPTPPSEEPVAGESSGDTEGGLTSLRWLARRFSWLAALAVAALLWMVMARRPRWLSGNGHAPHETVLRVYHRLDLLGRWLGTAARGATPREALSRLEGELQRRFGPQMAVCDLAPLYERARYGSAPVTWGDADHAATLWRRVRGQILRRAWRLVDRGAR